MKKKIELLDGERFVQFRESGPNMDGTTHEHGAVLLRHARQELRPCSNGMTGDVIVGQWFPAERINGRDIYQTGDVREGR